jgi:hypothetical protein
MVQTSRVARRWVDDRALLIASALALVTLLGSCGTALSTNRVTQDISQAVRSSEQVITADEIAAWGTSGGAVLRDGYDLVAALRPRFLRGDARNAVAQLQRLTPIVYVDRVRLGDVTVLRHIHPREIAFIRFYTAVEARSEFGDGHHGGAILVARRR